MAKILVERIVSRFPQGVVGQQSQAGDETVILKPEAWLDVCRFLRDEQSMEMLSDLTAVDYLGRQPRFDVVAHLYSLSTGQRLRLKTRVGNDDGSEAIVDSLTDLWGSANWAERECYDMFGIRFRGHPDLRRILLYPEFEGYPLRRDYPAAKIQPLVPYREIPNVDKLPPFDHHEGMSFGRQVHSGYGGQTDRDDELFPDDAGTSGIGQA